MLNGLWEKQVPTRLTKYLQINSNRNSEAMAPTSLVLSKSGLFFFSYSISVRKCLICWGVSVSNLLNQAPIHSKKIQWSWMRLPEDVMLYRADFLLLEKKIHLHLTPRKSIGVLGGTTGYMRSEYSLKNSKFFIAESNKQESSTESLYKPYSYTFVWQPKAKILKSTVIFPKQSLLPFLYPSFYAFLH